MARAPLLQLSQISLTFGGDPVFADLDVTVQQGDRLALVGRNGTGKSTLMKLMAGLVEGDQGIRALGPGQVAGYMEQDPDVSRFATLGDFATSALEPGEAYRVERAAEGLKLALDLDPAKASGGERRRAALAKILGEAPDLMLLDEPTNHLDIDAITWLEDELSSTDRAYVLISHDRRFLERLTRATLWLDRGVLRRQNKGFAAFEPWRDTLWAEEDLARHKLDRKIKAETKWSVEGISARRTRDMGRMRALEAMRAERRTQITRKGQAGMTFDEGAKSGRKVIEAKGLSKSFGDRTLIRNFDLRVLRGDRVAFIGPNGAGKTTLINMLTGALDPDAGSVTLGTGLATAWFDQTRAQLNPDATLWESLTGNPAMRIPGKADQVMVRGQPKHVVGYLKEFLFDEAQARMPVRALSGGEKARLLFARLMAQPANLLILDEPTNDLDIETLDLLEEILGSYEGTVLLVSHDRDFIDRLASITIALDGQGGAGVFAGGYTDYLAQRGNVEANSAPKAAPKPNAKPTRAQTKSSEKTGLTFTERHRLDALPGEIEQLEAEISKLNTLLADPELFSRDRARFDKATRALTERQEKLSAAESLWLDLAEKAETENS